MFKDPDVKFDIQFFKGTKPNGEFVWNSYTIINKKWYRVRGEILILKDNKVLAIKRDTPSKQGNYYNLPGGSAEPDKSLMDQTEIEALEEAGVAVKEMKYVNMYYISAYPSTNKSRLSSYEKKYIGSVSFIYVAKFNKYKSIPGRDSWDIETSKKYKFYDIDELELSDIHKDAIEKYLSEEKENG